MNYKEKIDNSRIPQHVAVIMDGNGRWAKKKGNQRIFGHRNGVKAVRETVEAAAELGMSCLTLYAFSTENWRRPRMEVDALMSLLVSALNDETPTLMKNNIRLLSIGDTNALAGDVRSKLEATIRLTAANSGLKLLLALNYSGRWDILDATNRICADVKAGKRNLPLSESDLGNYLSTGGLPDPELIIRTSGEYRISNFLLWQAAYSEFYFTPVLWPDFRKNDFHKAIVDFQQRERRFGKTSEQINESSENL